MSSDTPLPLVVTTDLLQTDPEAPQVSPVSGKISAGAHLDRVTGRNNYDVSPIESSRSSENRHLPYYDNQQAINPIHPQAIIPITAAPSGSQETFHVIPVDSHSGASTDPQLEAQQRSEKYYRPSVSVHSLTTVQGRVSGEAQDEPADEQEAAETKSFWWRLRNSGKATDRTSAEEEKKSKYPVYGQEWRNPFKREKTRPNNDSTSTSVAKSHYIPSRIVPASASVDTGLPRPSEQSQIQQPGSISEAPPRSTVGSDYATRDDNDDDFNPVRFATRNALMKKRQLRRNFEEQALKPDAGQRPVEVSVHPNSQSSGADSRTGEEYPAEDQLPAVIAPGRGSPTAPPKNTQTLRERAQRFYRLRGSGGRPSRTIPSGSSHIGSASQTSEQGGHLSTSSVPLARPSLIIPKYSPGNRRSESPGSAKDGGTTPVTAVGVDISFFDGRGGSAYGAGSHRLNFPGPSFLTVPVDNSHVGISSSLPRTQETGKPATLLGSRERPDSQGSGNWSHWERPPSTASNPQASEDYFPKSLREW